MKVISLEMNDSSLREEIPEGGTPGAKLSEIGQLGW
jgi:hypothetical protein